MCKLLLNVWAPGLGNGREDANYSLGFFAAVRYSFKAPSSDDVEDFSRFLQEFAGRLCGMLGYYILYFLNDQQDFGCVSSP